MRVSILTAIIVGLAAVAAACGSAEDSTVGGELHIYNWDDYFGPTTLEDFEAEFGIEVFLDTFEDENEAVSVIASDTSRYDLFIVSDNTVAEMAAEKLLAELDHENIPNLANIYPKYLDLPNDPGNRFGVPYDWGTTGIIYNTKCIDPEEESWGVLRDPAVSGKVAMDSDFRVVIGSILQYLGYPMNSRDEAQLDEAVSVLRDMRSQQGVEFLAWWDILDRMVAGELCAGQVFNGDAAYKLPENEDLAFFVPMEGSDLYFDTIAIPRDAPNKAGAELFINYILRPDVHAAINNYTGYASPNWASVEQGFIDEEFLSDPVSYPSIDNLEFWAVFDAETRALWNEAWAEVQRASPTAANQ